MKISLRLSVIHDRHSIAEDGGATKKFVLGAWPRSPKAPILSAQEEASLGDARSGGLAVVSLEESQVAAVQEEVAAAVLTHAQLLAAKLPAKASATTLLVAPRCEVLRRFEDYLAVCGWLEDAFEELDLNGKVQLATFHPEFRFEEAGEDAADFVGRSPFPAFHLLREEEVSAALAKGLQGQGDEESEPEAVGRRVSERNARFLRQRGIEKCLRDLRPKHSKMDIDLLHPDSKEEKAKHKLKRMIQSPNSSSDK
ncbi:unnamed protein product [Effrenium voratum]|uniref:Uncharacterized protein n=1 Tax=Effrenium voratum TaxID=2562239 RepID=A0AA36MLN5_9DINO|nr:unnamed protein product [Effrenium voratum]